MRQIKNIIIFCVLLLIGMCIYNGYDMNRAANNITRSFNKLLAKANKGNLFDITGFGDLVSEDDIKSLKDSGITGKDLSINATYYPYYSMLNNNEKNIYKQIVANVSNMKTTFVPVNDIDVNGLKKSVEAVFYDHPELFWLNTEYSYKYTKEKECVQIIMSFSYTDNNIDKVKSNFDSVTNKIINEASKYSSNYEKEKYVHDYIINNTDYNLKSSENQSAYSALVNRSSVCAGYARAFQYIMIKLGIPTYYVVGSASENHAWNMVALDDGYYNVDVTWDDQSKIIYNYFNKTDREFASTHTRHGLSLNLPSCSATKYSNKVDNKSNNTIKKIIRKYIITKPDNEITNNSNTNNSNDNSSTNNSNDNTTDDSNKFSNSNNDKVIDTTEKQNDDYIDNSEQDYDKSSMVDNEYENIGQKENND
ncbi:MAG: hypothetical protein IKF19_05580 [Bacilli bacterium]|nr:hypothetical protein [Bacilli bacterium]